MKTLEFTFPELDLEEIRLANLPPETLQVINPLEDPEENSSLGPCISASHFAGKSVTGKILPFYEGLPWGSELTYSDDSPSVRISSFEAGKSTPLMYNTKNEKRLIVLKGVIILEVYSEKTFYRYSLTPGVGWLIPPGLIHRFGSYAPSQLLTITDPNYSDYDTITLGT